MSLDFNFSLEELEAAEAATANPYLSNPAKGLELVARLVGQPSADLMQDEQRALLAQLHQLIHTDFIALTSKGSYPGEAQALRELLALEQSLENLALFPDLAQRTIVGVGGGFSAGKSRFLNTLLGVDLLPESLEPTTAIPSFIAHGPHDGIVALNSFNHKAPLDRDALQAITHAFNQHYRETLGESFGFAHILKLLMLHSPALAWQNLAFLDTPGYSKADTQANAQNDAAIAQRQLSEADHVLWLLNAKNGSIREDDLNFLRTLNPSQPVFFVVTQADLVGESRIQAILSSTQEAINNAGIPCAGLMAWAAPLNTTHGINMGGQDVRVWLDTLNNKQKTTQYGRQFERIIDGYIQFHRKNGNKSSDKISALNYTLSFSQDIPVIEQAALREMLNEQRHSQNNFNTLSHEFETLKETTSTIIKEITNPFTNEELSSEEHYEQGNFFKKNKKITESLASYKKSAELGHAEAQFSVGLCYWEGNGVKKDAKLAADWFKKAAEQNHNTANFILGILYKIGEGIDKNLEISAAYFRKAAELGDADAQYELAEYLFYGNGLKKDEAAAFSWYEKAAEQGQTDAEYSLGFCYFYGVGTQENENLAFDWYKKAANKEHAAAQYRLGLCYEKGAGVTANAKTAFQFLLKAAEQDFPKAQVKLGYFYKNGIGVEQNEQLAFNWYKKAAEQGDDQGQDELADCYYDGVGTATNKELAFSWYKKAAEQGNPFSQRSLGLCYKFGHGTQSDPKLAFYWYEKSAMQGNSGAQRLLAACYAEAIGVPQNYTLAFEWYSKAAEQGHAGAQVKLGDLYYFGRGVSKNYYKAVEWYKKSAEQGNAYAQYNLGYCLYNAQGISYDIEKSEYWVRKAAEQGEDLALELLEDPSYQLRIMKWSF